MTITPTHEELSWCLHSARTPQVRTRREFAEQELIIPEGKYAGTHFHVKTQPFSGLFLDELDSERWRRVAAVGCVQSGKSLLCFVLPVLYHLFELRETVIPGAPTMILAKDKFIKELLPVIRAGRYERFLPASGGGSRGGFSGEMELTNGAALKWMTGCGGDETKSSYTTRVVAITEADKMDTSREASREAPPIKQLEARMLSYDIDERQLYLECTVSIEEGCIWQEYTKGTASRIMCPCPHCGVHICPEREDLHGWQEAESIIQARELAYFGCPECGHRITEAQRIEMNRAARLLHRGQEIDSDGVIHGELPATDTLGFRWNAFNNLFWSPGSIGAAEWAGAHAEDEEEAKKELLQFYWATPYEPPIFDLTPLDAAVVKGRFGGTRRGMIPAETDYLSMGVDLGKRVGYWVLLAWLSDLRGHVCDYGTIEIASDDLGVERAMLAALRDFRETVLAGWPLPGGGMRAPDRVFIDARYQGDKLNPIKPVYQFVIESDGRFLPSLGFGTAQQYPQRYSRPKKTGASVKLIGHEYHIIYSPAEGCFIVEVNADQWKTLAHQALATPLTEPGSISLFSSPDKNEHTTFAKHVTAEKPTEEFVAGKGWVMKWIRERRANHYFDAFYNACAAGHLAGFRLTEPRQTAAPPSETPQPLSLGAGDYGDRDHYSLGESRHS